MNVSLILLLAFGLSMDAFAVSVTNGMTCRVGVLKNAFSSGLAFGLFQGVMPLLGYIAGQSFSDLIERIDHWVALILLLFIGGRMILEALKERKEKQSQPSARAFSLGTLTVQAVATSIDALAVGVGLGVMQVDILTAVSIIALVTFFFSFVGVLIGKRFGGMLQDKAEIVGGIVLIFIGVRIFVEHMAERFIL